MSEINTPNAVGNQIKKSNTLSPMSSHFRRLATVAIGDVANEKIELQKIDEEIENSDIQDDDPNAKNIFSCIPFFRKSET